jgi:hypothetical protein
MAEGQAKATVFTVRVTPSERATFDEAARRAGLPVTKWARRELLSAAMLK